MWLTILLATLLAVSPVDDLLAGVLSRLSRLEDGQAAAATQLDALNTEAVRSRRFRDAAANGELLRRLDPGPLDGSFGLRSPGSERVPDLSSPLVARLRSDAGMAGVAAGRVDPAQGYANLLDDPTLASISTQGQALTTSWARIRTADGTSNGRWEAKYVLDSGTVATTRYWSRDEDRWANDYATVNTAWGSSSPATLLLIWGANAGRMTVYLRPYANFDSLDPTLYPSYLVGAVQAWIATSHAALTEVTAYLDITDAAGTVLVTSDPDDLLTAYDSTLRTVLATAVEDPENAAGGYYWQFRVEIEWTASAGSMALQVAEPVLALSDDGSAPQFTPAIGRWRPEVVTIHGARAYRTGTQSIATSTDTAVQFDSATGASERYDTDDFHSLTSNTAQFVVPVSGVYHIDAGAGFAGNATGRRDLWIEANADGIKRALTRELNPTATDAYLTTSVDLDLTAGDYVRLMVWQNSGGNLNVLGNDSTTWLNIHLVGVGV